MSQFQTLASVGISAAVVLWGTAGTVRAQSGTRRSAPARSYRQQRPSSPAGSGARGPARAPAAMDGYCPVCLRDMHKWVQGNPAYQAVVDGHTYYFPAAKQKQAFLAHPEKYVPAMGGDCVVCYAKSGERIPGKIRYGTYYRDRLYLFASPEQKQAFAASPAAYADADLALGGNCPVCRVDRNAVVPGRPEWTVSDHGIRYQFQSAANRQKFLRNPARYRVAPPRPKAGGSGTRRSAPAPSSGGSGGSGGRG